MIDVFMFLSSANISLLIPSQSLKSQVSTFFMFSYYCVACYCFQRICLLFCVSILQFRLSLVKQLWNSSVHFISLLHIAQGNVFRFSPPFFHQWIYVGLCPVITVFAWNCDVPKVQRVYVLDLLSSREQWGVTKSMPPGTPPAHSPKKLFFCLYNNFYFNIQNKESMFTLTALPGLAWQQVPHTLRYSSCHCTAL